MEQSLGAFADAFRRLYGLEKPDVRTFSPLTLAYIGDAVYELVVRTYVVEAGNAPAHKLHQHASQMVKAQAQSDLITAIRDSLTEEELAVYKRGRNAKSYTKAKNATTHDYRRATGCEALIGYLYLTGQQMRLIELIHQGLKATEKLSE